MSNEFEKCPMCDDGHLQAFARDQEISEESLQIVVKGIGYSLCDKCHARVVTPNQSRTNKRLTSAARKQAMGLLAGEQIRSIRERFGINQAQAAAIFGGGRNAFSKYENEVVTQSDAMDKLLRLADEMPSAFAWLANRAGETEIALTQFWKAFHRIGIQLEKHPRFVEGTMQYAVNRTSSSASLTIGGSPANDHAFANCRLAVGA